MTRLQACFSYLYIFAVLVAIPVALTLAGCNSENLGTGNPGGVGLAPPDATEVVRHGGRWTSFRLVVGGKPRRFVLFDSGLGAGRVAHFVELREEATP
jgi:hypothetical protein